MTSEDVKYSFERIADPEFGSCRLRVDWEQLKEVQIVDKYTGIITLNEPFAPALLQHDCPTARAPSSASRRWKRSRRRSSPPTRPPPPAPTGSRSGRRSRGWCSNATTDGRGPRPEFDEIRICRSRTRRPPRSGSRRVSSTSPGSRPQLAAAVRRRAARELHPGGTSLALLRVARHERREPASSTTSGCARRCSTRSMWTASSRPPTSGCPSAPPASSPRVWSGTAPRT